MEEIEKVPSEEVVEETEQSLADMFGMTFKEDGSLDKISITNGMPIYRKLNHRERRIKAAIERRANKKKGK